ncbi:MAG: hypothetical protein R3B96_07200 [Pirellulaceae bacterium]
MELLLRKCDAAGVSVVPVFDFDAPILQSNWRITEHQFGVDQFDERTNSLRQMRLGHWSSRWVLRSAASDRR